MRQKLVRIAARYPVGSPQRKLILRLLQADQKPQGWEEFLRAKYEGGKKKVPNPNPDTREQHPMVTVNHLLKTDRFFASKVQEEFANWKRKQEGPEESSGQKDWMNPQKAKEVLGFTLPPDRHKRLEFDTSLTRQDREYARDLLDLPEDVDPEPVLADISGAALLGEGYSIDIKVMRGVGIDVSASGPYIRGHSRRIYRHGYQLVVDNENFMLEEDAPAGMGTKMFASQVVAAASLGAHRMRCEAAEGKGLVGYSVWPKLGYNGEVPEDAKGEEGWAEVLEELESLGLEVNEDYIMVQELFMCDKGWDYWHEYGTSFEAEFDLKKYSSSLEILKWYIEAKAEKEGLSPQEWMSKKANKKKNGAHEEIRLTSEDEALLREIWRRFRKKKLAQISKKKV